MGDESEEFHEYEEEIYDYSGGYGDDMQTDMMAERNAEIAEPEYDSDISQNEFMSQVITPWTQCSFPNENGDIYRDVSDKLANPLVVKFSKISEDATEAEDSAEETKSEPAWMPFTGVLQNLGSSNSPVTSDNETVGDDEAADEIQCTNDNTNESFVEMPDFIVGDLMLSSEMSNYIDMNWTQDADLFTTDLVTRAEPVETKGNEDFQNYLKELHVRTGKRDKKTKKGHNSAAKRIHNTVVGWKNSNLLQPFVETLQRYEEQLDDADKKKEESLVLGVVFMPVEERIEFGMLLRDKWGTDATKATVWKYLKDYFEHIKNLEKKYQYGALGEWSVTDKEYLELRTFFIGEAMEEASKEAEMEIVTAKNKADELLDFEMSRVLRVLSYRMELDLTPKDKNILWPEEEKVAHSPVALKVQQLMKVAMHAIGVFTGPRGGTPLKLRMQCLTDVSSSVKHLKTRVMQVSWRINDDKSVKVNKNTMTAITKKAQLVVGDLGGHLYEYKTMLEGFGCKDNDPLFPAMRIVKSGSRADPSFETDLCNPVVFDTKKKCAKPMGKRVFVRLWSEPVVYLRKYDFIRTDRKSVV